MKITLAFKDALAPWRYWTEKDFEFPTVEAFREFAERYSVIGFKLEGEGAALNVKKFPPIEGAVHFLVSRNSDKTILAFM